MNNPKKNASGQAGACGVTGKQFKNKSHVYYNPNWLRATVLTALNLALLGLVIWGLA